MCVERGYMLDSEGRECTNGVCEEAIAVQIGCGVSGVSGHLPHTPSSSGELHSLQELKLCVLIVVTCLAVVVECAQHMRSVRSSGSVHVRCCVCGVSWSAPTHSEQFRCASTIARACIVCVDCSSVFRSSGGMCTAHAECTE